jgi:hypothetical protein
LVFGTLLCGVAVYAQDAGNRREQRIALDRDTIRLDSVSIAPGSLSLWRDSALVDTSFYGMDPWHALLFRRPGAPIDTLDARYRSMPLLLAGP